jgi:hypothetical protein
MYYACEAGSRFDARFVDFSTISSTEINRTSFSLDKSNTYLMDDPSHNLKVAGSGEAPPGEGPTIAFSYGVGVRISCAVRQMSGVHHIVPRSKLPSV